MWSNVSKHNDCIRWVANKLTTQEKQINGCLTFLQHFLEILKRSLQNFYEILKHIIIICNTCIVLPGGGYFQLHFIVPPVSEWIKAFRIRYSVRKAYFLRIFAFHRFHFPLIWWKERERERSVKVLAYMTVSPQYLIK